MLTQTKNFSKRVLKKLPLIERYLRHRDERGQFRVERALIQGKHRNRNTRPSIIHFSMNKAATQYTKAILRRCAAHNDMVPVAIHDYAFNTNFPYFDFLSAAAMQRYHHIFKPQGYLYSVFGGMIEGIPDLEKYRVVLMIRDPRDVLVSEYYSIAYSHVVPDMSGDKFEEFMNRRNTAQKMTIDEFVSIDADRVCGILERYRSLLVNKYPDTYITRYEEMVTDFQSWLPGLIRACRLEITDDLLRSMLEENNRLRPKAEDARRHIRKGTAGDYKEKLKPDTIDRLNTKLSSFLDTFGYEI